MPILENHLLTNGTIQRRRSRSLWTSEVMTILIHFHQSHYRDFKAYYCEHVQKHLRGEFPVLVSYQRFVEYIPSVLINYLPICAAVALASVLASLSSIRHPSKCVTAGGSSSTRSLQVSPSEVIVLPAGSLASNCI